MPSEKEREKLEREANKILYNAPSVEFKPSEIFRVPTAVHYTPKDITKPVERKHLKCLAKSAVLKCHYQCEECGKPRSVGSGKLCRFCYRVQARLKYIDIKESEFWLPRYRGWDVDLRDEDSTSTPIAVTLPTVGEFKSKDLPATGWGVKET